MRSPIDIDYTFKAIIGIASPVLGVITSYQEQIEWHLRVASLLVGSAGLNHDAEVPLSAEQVEWAELIMVMEKEHRSRLNRKFGKSLAGKRVVVLNIPDDYEYMDPVLVRLLEQR